MLKMAAFATAAGLLAGPSLATHSWSTYHWKRVNTEVTPPLGDNVNTTWDSYIRTANSDWNRSTRIQSAMTTGQTTPSTCSPRAGRIEVCNAAYGSTGWLGIASVWLGSDGHISQATTKLNDTYFNTAQYNTFSWRQLVACQEIGHNYGLAHQDENFSTDLTNSCMDYTNLPAGNEHPDQHDYDQIAAIYSHAHAAANLPTSEPSAQAIGNTRADFGRPIGQDAHGRDNVFMRDLAGGRKVITDVFWVPGHDDGHSH